MAIFFALILVTSLIGSIQLHMRGNTNGRYTRPDVTYGERSITKEEEQNIKNDIEAKKREKQHPTNPMVDVKREDKR